MTTDYKDTMYTKVDGKPCPFCGCTEIRSYSYLHSGGWTINVECSRCPAQMPSDNVQAALERWNTRANDDSVRRAIAHMKQMEWERDRAVMKLEWEEDMKSESVNVFLAGHHGVQSAKHSEGFVYIGRDSAERWWIQWNGELEMLNCPDGEKNLVAAKKEAHQKIDDGNQCSLNLEWSEIA